MWICRKCNLPSDGTSRICRACGGIIDEIPTPRPLLKLCCLPNWWKKGRRHR